MASVPPSQECEFDHPHPDHPCGRPIPIEGDNTRKVQSVGWRLPLDLKARIDAAASERGVPTNWFVERLLAEALEGLLPPEAFRLTRPKE